MRVRQPFLNILQNIATIKEKTSEFDDIKIKRKFCLGKKCNMQSKLYTINGENTYTLIRKSQ